MPLHEFPKCYDDVKELFESYVQLVKDNRRLKTLVDSGLGSAAKVKVNPKPTGGGSSSSNGWASAPSVAEVEKMKPKPKPKPKPVEDSDDDSPLPRKGDPHANPKGKKRPASDDHEGGPKPPKKRSAYNLFMGVRNSELQKHLAEKGVRVQNNTDRSELLSKVGKEWKELSDADRAIWQTKADKMNAELLADYESKCHTVEDSEDE